MRRIGCYGRGAGQQDWYGDIPALNWYVVTAPARTLRRVREGAYFSVEITAVTAPARALPQLGHCGETARVRARRAGQAGRVVHFEGAGENGRWCGLARCSSQIFMSVAKQDASTGSPTREAGIPTGANGCRRGLPQSANGKATTLRPDQTNYLKDAGKLRCQALNHQLPRAQNVSFAQT